MKQDILIGTMVKVDENIDSYVRQIITYGFESIALTFGHDQEDMMDPAEAADCLMPVLEGTNVKVAAIEVFGNPLLDTPKAEKLRAFINRMIDCAHLFDTDLVTGFTGCLNARQVPDTIPVFKKIWTPICERAGEKNIRIAFENCTMGGNWWNPWHNIAFHPRAWELMFEAVPFENVGIEWEHAHLVEQMIDPLPQMRKWMHRIFHLHGKDAQVRKDILAKDGITGPEPIVYHRLPGFGDSNWVEIFSELRKGGFKGAIDIEGWHDPVYCGDLEMTGQVFALNFLKQSRGTLFPNPI